MRSIQESMGEGTEYGRYDAPPASADNGPRPPCGMGMTLQEATEESGGCCVVSDVKRGGPVDLFLAPGGVVRWFLAGVREQSHWLGTPNSGVPIPGDIAHTYLRMALPGRVWAT